MIKRKITSFFLLLFLSFALLSSPLTVFAAPDSINSIDVTVDLASDGSAHITQVWHTDVNDGTEFYIPQIGLGDIEIKDFSVSDVNYGQYKFVDDWDVDDSFDEKAGKYGLNEVSDGVELCWGKTSLGDNTYTLTYTMTNFVKEYADGAFGLYSRFVNSGIDPSPQKVSVTIQQEGAKFSKENAGLWSFGFNGEFGFTDDGKVVVTSSEPFVKESHITLLMRLDQSLVTKAAKSDRTFNELQEIALSGSDYDADEAYANYYEGSDSSSLFESIMFFIIAAVPCLGALGISRGYTKAGNAKMAPPLDEKNLAYYRDIPYNGYLPAAFYTLGNYAKLGNKSDAISAYFLRWIKSGVVTVETRDKKTFLGMGANTATSLVFHNPPTNDSNIEKALYDMMIQAAGGDQILQEKELQNWSNSNYSTLSAWFDSVEQSGANYYTNNNLSTTAQQPYAFNMLKRTVTQVNDAGLQANKNLFGFKKYLQDYTLVAERHANEAQLWDEYLVFASLFGIADQVAKDFTKINPKFFETAQYQQGGGDFDFFTTYLFLNALSNASYQGMKAGQYSSSGTRSGGGGGFSSFGGGGGGFSGGGFGGGSR